MGNAASIAAGNKPGDVRQNATANGDDRLIPAIDRETVQFAQNAEIVIDRFIFLPGWKNNDLCFDLVNVKIFSDLFREVLINVFVDDDKSAGVCLFASG